MDYLLLSLKQENPQMSIVVVTHDMQSVFTIADHVIILGNKTILFNGSLQELKASTDPYIMSFLERKSNIDNIKESALSLTEKELAEVDAALKQLTGQKTSKSKS